MKTTNEVDHFGWEPEVDTVVYGLYCVCVDCELAHPGLIRYCGQTVRTANARFTGHKARMRMLASGKLAGQKQTPVERWGAKHGAENIRMVVLEKCGDLDELNLAEERWIAHLETVGKPGLNIRSGGKNVRHGPMSDEQKLKIGASNKARDWRPSAEHIAWVTEHLSSRKGELNYRAKLTNAQVVKIKERLFLGHYPSRIGLNYGVSADCVRSIARGTTWAHVPKPIGPYPQLKAEIKYGDEATYKKLSEAAVIEIKSRLWDGEYPIDLHKEFGVSLSTIGSIESGSTWGHIPWPADRERSIRNRYERVSSSNSGKQRTSEQRRRIKAATIESGTKRSVLSAPDVRSIRELSDSGFSYPEIVTRMSIEGLSTGMVGKIVRKERWRHVE